MEYITRGHIRKREDIHVVDVTKMIAPISQGKKVAEVDLRAFMGGQGSHGTRARDNKLG